MTRHVSRVFHTAIVIPDSASIDRSPTMPDDPVLTRRADSRMARLSELGRSRETLSQIGARRACCTGGLHSPASRRNHYTLSVNYLPTVGFLRVEKYGRSEVAMGNRWGVTVIVPFSIRHPSGDSFISFFNMVLKFLVGSTYWGL